MRRVHSPSYLSFVIINVVLNVEISDERREGGRELRIADTQEGVLFGGTWCSTALLCLIPLTAALDPR